jgi:hypothetical protein
MDDSPPPKRRWFRLSLRMLLILVPLYVIPASLIAIRLQTGRNKRELAAEFSGGTVGFRELGGLFSSDFSVASIYFNSLTDADLKNLQGRLEEQPDLKVLVLRGTQVTDAGLVHLQGLKKLDLLHLGNTQVTDAGLSHLQGLTQLRSLDLAGTQVTEEGVSRLREALPDCRIGWDEEAGQTNATPTPQKAP